MFVIAVLLSASCFTITGVNKRADHSITSGLTWSKSSFSFNINFNNYLEQISKVTQCNHKLHFDVNNETLLLLALNLFLVERKIIAELTRTDFLNATKVSFWYILFLIVQDIAFAIHSLITYPHLFNSMFYFAFNTTKDIDSTYISSLEYMLWCWVKLMQL